MLKNETVQSYYEKTVSENSNNFNGFLRQVGKTFLGETINEYVFMKIITNIIDNLNIDVKDKVLDLGCANGLITFKVANYTEHIYGYDLSNDLIQVAKKFHNTKNITYKQKNIFDIDFTILNVHKIYMYEVLQHFEYKMLKELLSKLTKEVTSFSFFIGSIPDKNKILEFYNTKERRRYLFNELLENKKSHLGNWWYQEHILLLCDDLGLNATIIEQDSELHTAHYRFDVLIEKK